MSLLYKNSEKDYGSEYIDKALNDVNALYDSLDTSRMTAKQASDTGKEIASSLGGAKASKAKREAKAASMMNNAGRVQSAVQGAQAASDAVSSSFDENAQYGSNLAINQENAEKEAQANKIKDKASNILKAAEDKQNAKAAATKEDTDWRRGIISSLPSLIGSFGR